MDNFLIEIKQKWAKTFLYIFFAISTVMMLVIISLSYAKPAHNLLPLPLFFASIVFVLLAFAFLYIWSKIYKKIGSHNAIYYPLLGVYFVGLYLFALKSGFIYLYFQDLRQIYEAALSVVNNEDFMHLSYFNFYNNNIGPMIFFVGLIRFSNLIKCNPFYVLLTVSTLKVVVSAWAAGILLGKRLRFPALVFFAVFIPFWGSISSFYTDTMSVHGGILALALFKLSLDSKKHPYVYDILAAVTLTIACIWKITTLFPVIAFSVVMLLRWKKTDIKKILVFLVPFFCLFFISSIYIKNYPPTRNCQYEADPAIAWVALGMGGNGNYSENYIFINQVHELHTKEEKAAFSKEYIKNNYKELLTTEHFVRKLQLCYANGDVGVCDYVWNSPTDTPIYKFFNGFGQYFWRTSQYCFCFISMIYFVLLIGSVKSIFDIHAGRKISGLWLTSLVSFAGMFLLLLFWEASNRQLLNQMPILITGLIAFLSNLPFVSKTVEIE